MMTNKIKMGLNIAVHNIYLGDISVWYNLSENITIPLDYKFLEDAVYQKLLDEGMLVNE